MKRVCRLVLAAWLGLASQAGAATVAISPVILEITAQQQAVTTLSNVGKTPVEFTATLVRWSQKDGQDVTEATRDGLVNPPRFSIAPGHAQVVRIGLRLRPSNPQVTYRLILRQSPESAVITTSELAKNQLSGALTPTYVFSLPLFVSQPNAQAKTTAHLERSAQGLAWVVSNTGSAYEAFRNVTLSFGNQTLPLGGLYILAGSTMRLPLPAAASALSTLTLSYTDKAKSEHRDTLNVPAP